MNRVGLNIIAFFTNKSSITVCNKYGNLILLSFIVISYFIKVRIYILYLINTRCPENRPDIFSCNLSK